MMFPKFFRSNTTSWIECKWKFRYQDRRSSETEIVSLNRIDAWELKNREVEHYHVPRFRLFKMWPNIKENDLTRSLLHKHFE